MTEYLQKNRFWLRFGLMRGDMTLWTIYIVFTVVSLVEVYSAGSRLGFKTGNYFATFSEHLTHLVIGYVIVVVMHNIHYRWFNWYAVFAGIVSVPMLIYLMIWGKVVNGASRAITLFGINMQPSEFAKGAVVIITAIILSLMHSEKGTDKRAFKWILCISLLFCILIMPENLSTAGILFFVTILMMFIARVPALQLAKLICVLVILGLAVNYSVKVMPIGATKKISCLHRLRTWVTRCETFNTKPLSPEDFDVEKDAQVAHSHIAIASSGILGKFPGNSTERDFLSQATSDFIYAIIIEEIGLFGGAVILLLYIIMVFRSARIARKCERNFPAFLVLGLTMLLVTQALVNMAVAVGAIPITGQPLPFISRGGSSILINSVYMGMILSVSRYAKDCAKKNSAQKGDGAVNESEFVGDEVIN